MKTIEIAEKANEKKGTPARVIATVNIAEHTYHSVAENYGTERADALFEERIDSLAKGRISSAIRIAQQNSANPKHADYGKQVDVQAVAQKAANEFVPQALRGEGDGTKRALGSVASATARYQAGEIQLDEFLKAIQAATESVVKTPVAVG